jgi:hypothetical protein
MPQTHAKADKITLTVAAQPDGKPASSTVDRWRGVFLRLQEDFPSTSAAALLPEQMQEWANRMIEHGRTAATVANIWVRAARTVFAWGIDERLIARNPFVGWRCHTQWWPVPEEVRSHFGIVRRRPCSTSIQSASLARL